MKYKIERYERKKGDGDFLVEDHDHKWELVERINGLIELSDFLKSLNQEYAVIEEENKNRIVID